MFFRRRFSRRGAGRKIRGRKGYRAKRKVSKSVKRYVKRAIRSNIENKIRTYYEHNMGLVCANGTAPSVFPLVPITIGQGSADGSRVGNQIKITSSYIRGQVNLLPWNATTNPLSTPIWVKMWVLRTLNVLGQQTASTVGNQLANNMFNLSGLNSGPMGLPLDLDFPINKGLYEVKATKTFKLGAASATTGGQVGTGGYFDNSPMCKRFYFNTGRFLKKHIKFDESASPVLYPTNTNLYLVIQCVYADGSTSAVSPAELHYCNVFNYEDA